MDDTLAAVVQRLAYVEERNVVDDDPAVTCRCGQTRSIIRELQVPDLVRLLIEPQRRFQREMTSIARVIEIEGRRYGGVVIQTAYDLVLLHLVQQDREAPLGDHDRGGYRRWTTTFTRTNQRSCVARARPDIVRSLRGTAAATHSPDRSESRFRRDRPAAPSQFACALRSSADWHIIILYSPVNKRFLSRNCLRIAMWAGGNAPRGRENGKVPTLTGRAVD